MDRRRQRPFYQSRHLFASTGFEVALETGLHSPKDRLGIIAGSCLLQTKVRSTMIGPVAVFHDYFAIKGGGERLAVTLANGLGATLVCGYRTSDSYPAQDFPASTHEIGFPRIFRYPGIRPILLSASFAAHRPTARSFDVRIFSGVAAPFAAPPRECQGLNVFYCHTPPRFLFDQKDHFLGSRKGPKQVVAATFESFYRRAVARMHVVVTNSETTRARIKSYLGLESIVIYPPIDTDRFRWRGQGDYFLSVARLTSLKRVDRIIDAFLQLPNKRLIVVSGGEDLEKLRAKAAIAHNIEIRGWIDDHELMELLGHSIATIYVPKDEDFGMSAVESLAAGKPVIGVAEGGLLETVTQTTGILLDPSFSTADLIGAINAMTPQLAQTMRKTCEERAQQFTRASFLSNVRLLLEQAAVPSM